MVTSPRFYPYCIWIQLPFYYISIPFFDNFIFQNQLGSAQGDSIMDYIRTTIRNILVNFCNNSGNNKSRWNLNNIQKGSTISGYADWRKLLEIDNKNNKSRWNLPR